MTMSQRQPPSPLTVREQLEASAFKLWSSVTNLSLDDHRKVGHNESLNSADSSSTTSHDDDDTAYGGPNNADAQVSLQSVLHAVFGSCTTGATASFGIPASSSSASTNKDRSGPLGGSRSTRSVRRSSSSKTNNTTTAPNSSNGTTNSVGTKPKSPSGIATTTRTEDESEPKRPSSSFPQKTTISSVTKKLFPDNHDRAEAAVLHLREKQCVKQEKEKETLLEQKQRWQEHQLQQHLLLRNQMEQSRGGGGGGTSGGKGRESIATSAAQAQGDESFEHNKGPLATASAMAKDRSAFFPASKPMPSSHGNSKTAHHKAHNRPGHLHTSQSLHDERQDVPKEVSSPPRKANGKAYPSISYGASFDVEDDGVSIITQDTVDGMVQALEAMDQTGTYLHRVYSDATDPVDTSFADWKENLNLSIMSSDANTSLFPAVGDSLPTSIKAAGLLPRQPHRDCGGGARGGGGVMSPPRLSRETRSTGTRSFFSRTSHSTHTDDIHRVWKMEEQEYWSSLVARQTTENADKVILSTENGLGITPMIDPTHDDDAMEHYDGTSGGGTGPSCSPRFKNLRKVRDKVKRNFPQELRRGISPAKETVTTVHSFSCHTDSSNTGSRTRAVPSEANDRLMDVWMLHNPEIAEI